MVLLMVVTVGYLPIVLPLLLPGVTVNPWEIARSLLLLMLLPLGIGLALKARYGDLAARVKPALDWISNVSLILLIMLDHRSEHRQSFSKSSAREESLRDFCLSRWALGLVGCSADPDTDTKRVMALGTGQRNIAAALVVASSKLQRPESGRHGHRRRDRRIDRPHAAFSCRWPNLKNHEPKL